MRDPLAHGLEHRPRLLEGGRVAPDEEGERSVGSALLAAGDRRIEPIRRLRSASLRAIERAASAAIVEQSITIVPARARGVRSLPPVRGGPPRPRANPAGTRRRRQPAARPSSSGVSQRAGIRPPRRSARAFVGRVGKAAQRKSRLREVARHAGTHRPEPDESDFECHGELLPAPSERNSMQTRRPRMAGEREIVVTSVGSGFEQRIEAGRHVPGATGRTAQPVAAGARTPGRIPTRCCWRRWAPAPPSPCACTRGRSSGRSKASPCACLPPGSMRATARSAKQGRQPCRPDHAGNHARGAPVRGTEEKTHRDRGEVPGSPDADGAKEIVTRLWRDGRPKGRPYGTGFRIGLPCMVS